MLRTVLTIAALACVAMVTIANAQQKPKAVPNDGRQFDAAAIEITVRVFEKHATTY